MLLVTYEVGRTGLQYYSVVYIYMGGGTTLRTTDCDWAVARKFDVGTAVFDTGSTSWWDGRVCGGVGDMIVRAGSWTVSSRTQGASPKGASMTSIVS